MKRKAFIYVEEVFERGHKMKSILPVEFTFNFSEKVRDKDFEKIIAYNLNEKKCLETRDKCNMNTHMLQVEKTEPVYIKRKSRFYDGEYYAHEYDLYTGGKVRRVEYSNGYVEYEVVCKSKNLTVLDGMYSEEDRYYDRYANGCGDYFETYEMTPWTKKERGL